MSGSPKRFEIRNKRHLTKYISKNTSRTLDLLSNVTEMKFKSKKLPKYRQTPEAIKVQSDMSHMCRSLYPVRYYCIHYVLMHHKPAIITLIHNNRKFSTVEHIWWANYINAIGQFVVVIYQ